jgi:hypothetical protein
LSPSTTGGKAAGGSRVSSTGLPCQRDLVQIRKYSLAHERANVRRLLRLDESGGDRSSVLPRGYAGDAPMLDLVYGEGLLPID